MTYIATLFMTTTTILIMLYVSKSNTQKTKDFTKLFYYISIFAVIVAFLSPIYIREKMNHNVAEMGPTGDWLSGSTSPFLTFASVLMILAAFIQQRKELEITKKDSENQKKTLAIQRFENTFFQLMNLHNEIVNSITVWEDASGRNALSKIYTGYKSYKKHDCEVSIEQRKDDIKDIYFHWYSVNEHNIGHYYRSLYHIFNLIHSSSLDDNEKEEYAKLLRAQLSKAELLLLFYNSIAFDQDNKFIPLIRKYKILKHINIGELVCPEIDQKILNREYPNE